MGEKQHRPQIEEPGAEEERKLVGNWSVEGGGSFRLLLEGGAFLYREKDRQRPQDQLRHTSQHQFSPPGCTSISPQGYINA